MIRLLLICIVLIPQAASSSEWPEILHDEDYNIRHILYEVTSSANPDLLSVVNSAYEINNERYNILRNLKSAEPQISPLLHNLFSPMLENIKRTPEYQSVKSQTDENLKNVKAEWQKNYRRSKRIVESLVRSPIVDSPTVYITHPAVANGVNFGGKGIGWSGFGARFSNYHTVYVWHEILHSHFDSSRISHAVIELITDNALQGELNQTVNTHRTGHGYLAALRSYIHRRYWQSFLRNTDETALEFVERLKKDPRIRKLAGR